MSLHIEANKGDIAETVLIPGDPLRAKYIAENFLDQPHCYSRTRNMLGYTGLYKNKRLSVQASGMGMPSMHIYSTELIDEFGVNTLIRLGSCGALQKDIQLGDVIIAMAASTDSNILSEVFPETHWAACAHFALIRAAAEQAEKNSATHHVGPVFTSDLFYSYKPNTWKNWSEFGALAVEMETAALYTVAAQKKKKALSILTVSDQLCREERTEHRYEFASYNSMIEIALESLIHAHP